MADDFMQQMHEGKTSIQKGVINCPHRTTVGEEKSEESLGLEQLADVDLSNVSEEFQSVFVELDCPEEEPFVPGATAPVELLT